MTLIQLSNSHLSALVDDEDFEALNKFKWYLGFNNGREAYVRRQRCGDKNVYLMHRVVLGLPVNKGFRHTQIVDHINRNVLDNRKCNLRVVDHQANSCNRERPKRAKLPYRGLRYKTETKHKDRPWNPKITWRHKGIHLGYYATAEEAAFAYDVAAPLIHGEVAQLNGAPFNAEVKAEVLRLLDRYNDVHQLDNFPVA